MTLRTKLIVRMSILVVFFLMGTTVEAQKEKPEKEVASKKVEAKTEKSNAALQMAKPQSSMSASCPKNQKGWENFQVKESNAGTFEKCVAQLKKEYTKGNELEYMNSGEMKNTLLVSYQHLADFYHDTSMGDDEEKAMKFESEMEKVKKSKAPKKSKKSKNK